MDAMKCFISQRDVSDRMKSHLPPPRSLYSLSLCLNQSFCLSENQRIRERVESRGRKREWGRGKQQRVKDGERDGERGEGERDGKERERGKSWVFWHLLRWHLLSLLSVDGHTHNGQNVTHNGEESINTVSTHTPDRITWNYNTYPLLFIAHNPQCGDEKEERISQHLSLSLHKHWKSLHLLHWHHMLVSQGAVEAPHSLLSLLLHAVLSSFPSAFPTRTKQKQCHVITISTKPKERERERERERIGNFHSIQWTFLSLSSLLLFSFSLLLLLLLDCVSSCFFLMFVQCPFSSQSKHCANTNITSGSLTNHAF